LDEPTNDLDIDTLRQLEDLLDGWPGTMVVISHDRYLVERICDSVWALFGDGQLTNLPRGIDEYLERRRVAGAAGDSGKVSRSTPGAASASAGGSGAGAAGGSATAPALSAAEERALTKEMSKIERQMGKLDKREAELHKAMADVSAGAMDTEKLAALDRELKDVSAEKDTLEERWMELGEQIEG
ncbi:ABC-F family ATP-binding cassette domain-containing protein, partial [Dietzia sp. SLG510A3-3B2-2]|nr:ABC-F family ATP-binding cassette domain-containing protein [Dietzia sp. SLG510A3-40A3]MBB1010282.1 ABC-F family ATP-binding cassette domain-containing protein [Dietzia sp. SLG510A3-3B2-2]